MKRINISLSKRMWLLIITCMISVLFASVLHMVSSHFKNKLPHEQVAKLWDKEGDTAHVSVFFSEEEKYSLKQDLESTQYQIESWHHNLLTSIAEANVETAGVTNANARNSVYGYHANGKVTIANNKKKVEVKAYGVGGDFFLFHPVTLIQGSYFSESDLMHDRIILDTETAWQLFGSNDIVGMFVTIQDIPHMVVGVYERERSTFADAAGNVESNVYVSHSTLQKYGVYYGLESVEYLVPNPVTGFGKGLVETQFEGKDVALVEHQNRFSFVPLLDIASKLSTRSMQTSGISFPYWENMARGYEDILARLMIWEMVFWLYAVVVAVGFVWYLWLHRTWRVKQIYEKAKDYHYARSVKRNIKKQNKNSEGEDL